MKLSVSYRGWLPIYTSRSSTERVWNILGILYICIEGLKQIEFDDYGKRISDHR